MRNAIVIFLVVLMVGVGAVAFVYLAVSQSENSYRQREREWMQFSQAHHCKVVREPGFFEVTTTWECDGGFQVVRP